MQNIIHYDIEWGRPNLEKNLKTLYDFTLNVLDEGKAKNLAGWYYTCLLYTSIYYNNFENDSFDWFSFNEAIIREHLKGGCKAIVVDPSFIPKLGSKTPWIGYFRSGCAGEYRRGLEITGIGGIDVDNHECMTLGSVQTPDNTTLESLEKNLVD